MIDYGYDVAAQGYDLSGMPIHPLKHEHYKLDDSPVNLIMTKASTLFLMPRTICRCYYVIMYVK